jgi:hypothetical protein
MARVLAAWDAHLSHPALPRTLAVQLRAARFEDVLVEGHTFATTELAPDTYGGAITGFVEEYVAGLGQDEAADARAWGAEQRELAQRGEFFFACVQFCFAAKRAG